MKKEERRKEEKLLELRTRDARRDLNARISKVHAIRDKVIYMKIVTGN